MNQDLATPGPFPASSSAAPGARICDASEWGLLAIDGDDARSFLQGQLSSDVEHLAAGAGHWTTWSSAKGRMLANGWLWRTPDGSGYRWAVSADIAAATAKRLAMFVLRAKVAVADRTATTVRLGLGGPGAREAVEAAIGDAPLPGRTIEREGATWAALADGRILVVCAPDAAAAIRARLATYVADADAHAWRRLGILAGTPLVDAATREALLPQAANQDALGAIVLSREKGCFPGQEIIKRMQSRGELKERLYAYRLDGEAPAHGTRVFGTTFGEQACGTVVAAAPSPEGGTDVLAVVQVAASGDALRVGDPGGRVLAPRTLPYAIPANEPRPRPDLR